MECSNFSDASTASSARWEAHMSSPPFRWGVLAPGRIAHRFAQALDSVEGARLHAVASRSPERGRAFAQRYRAARQYDSYEALACDPQVDAVYIASPHRFHHEQVRLCLEAGKPVLVEKPFTVNAPQATDLIALAQTKDLFLMEALWSRFLPVHRRVREWLDQGAIGAIHLISSTFCFRAEPDPSDRKFSHELAGGALLDLGVYSVSLSQWATGENPSTVSALARLGATNVDELTAVTMVYAHDTVSQFTCSLLFDAVNDFLIYGARGHIRVQANFWESTRATLVVDGKETVAALPFRRNGFEYQIEEAMTCIREGRRESKGMPLASTLSNLKTMDEVRRQIGLRYSFE
jgi:predicted dehydrogenase